MRGKKWGLWSSISLLLSGTLFFYMLFFAPGWHAAVSEPLRLNFPGTAIYCNNVIEQWQQRHAGREKASVGLEEPVARVVPGGQSIGVLLHCQGVIVVGYSAIQDQYGNSFNPAGDAGINLADVILKINGEDVENEEQIRDLAAEAGTVGQSLSLQVKRGESILQINVKPVYCTLTSRYRIGLLIKDSAAGLGTLTFYDPESMVYGAVGHMISDVGSTEPFDLSEGKIVGASVQTIHRGKRGQPGEKIGTFQGDKQIHGTIFKNSKLGIFGNLLNPIEQGNDGDASNNAENTLMPVMPANQIHDGPAELLTVLTDDQVERFSVEISKINLKAAQDGKAMIVKITDPRLLEEAGGIIQGMSGSPIIQNGSLVGAITHVFVNDPTRGYGVPVEWMLQEAEILSIEKNNKLAS